MHFNERQNPMITEEWTRVGHGENIIISVCFDAQNSFCVNFMLKLIEHMFCNTGLYCFWNMALETLFFFCTEEKFHVISIERSGVWLILLPPLLLVPDHHNVFLLRPISGVLTQPPAHKIKWLGLPLQNLSNTSKKLDEV